MRAKKVMQTVLKTINELGLSSQVPDRQEQAPYETCVVNFGTDEGGRAMAVQIIHYSQDTLVRLHEIEAEPNPSNISILSFVMTIPIEIPQKTAGEVLRLMCLANKSLPLGDLNFSEVEKAIYYTYSIPVFEEPPSQAAIISVLQTATFVKETYISAFDEVARGETTVNAILELPEEPVRFKSRPKKR